MDDFTDLPEEDVAAHFLAIHLLVSSRVAVGDGFAFADIARDIADDGLWNDSAARASVADWALRADAEDRLNAWITGQIKNSIFCTMSRRKE